MNRRTAFLIAAALAAAGPFAATTTAAPDRDSGRIQPDRNFKRGPGPKIAPCARAFAGGPGRFKLGSMPRRKGHTEVESYVCSYSARIVCATGMVADRPSMRVSPDGRIIIHYRCHRQSR